MSTLAPSVLIRSSSFLQVTRPCMKAWMSSNFDQIPPPTPELSALACPEKLMYNVVNTLGPSIFYRIFFSFAGNEDNHKVLDEFEI